MKENILKILVCPQCHSALTLAANTSYKCGLCNSAYTSESGCLNFTENKTPEKNGESKYTNSGIYEFLKKIFLQLRPSSTYKTKKSKNRIFGLVNALSHGDISLNIGAGKTNYHPSIINIDIELTETVDIIADARSLPIKSATVSLVISQAVLEHSPDTKGNIEEITRVLKANGILYIEVPFMQTYHAHPHDYYRFTHNGIKTYLRDYDVYEEGIAVGPASATALNLRIFLSTLLSFGNRKIFLLLSLIFAWLTHPIKYLDCFMESNPLAFYGASGIYIIARKKP